jgi:hypothetical protein
MDEIQATIHGLEFEVRDGVQRTILVISTEIRLDPRLLAPGLACDRTVTQE